MTKAGIKQIIQKHGTAAFVVIGFDNDKATYYLENNYADDSMFATFDGTECVVAHSFILNKDTGRYDIPVTTYKPIEFIQTIIVLDKADDRRHIHVGDLQMR